MHRSLLVSVLRRVEALSTDGRVTDADLVRRFVAERDEAAFTALVRRHGPLVWAVCRHLLHNDADAEDAFQATFLVLVRNARSMRNPAALGAWLHGVAYRVAQKAKRSAARRRHREHATACTEAAKPIPASAWDQLRAALHEEVGKLPESLRTAFVLCELEGVGQARAAAALGWKLGTLSGRLCKARQILLDRLARRGIPTAAAVTGAVIVGSATSAAPPLTLAAAVSLARPDSKVADAVSASVLELARKATEVSMTRTKMIAAAIALTAVLAAGTATTLIPMAKAQRPPGPASGGDQNDADPFAPQPGGPGAGYGAPRQSMSGGMSSASPAGQWEYKFVPRKSESLEEFQRVLTENGNSGWEFCGVQSLTATDPAHKAEWGTNPTIVFKRPKIRMRSLSGQATFGSSPAPGSSTAPPGMSGAGKGSAIGGPPGMTGAPKGGGSGMGGFSGMPGGPGFGGGGGSGGIGGFSGMWSGGGRGPTGPAGMAGQPNSPDSKASRSEVFVMRLQHAESEELAKSLKELFKDRNCKIIADARTNSLLVQADEDALKAITAVIQKIDVPGEEPKRNKQREN